MGIVGGLLIGWILSWFGFKAVVVAGMAQLFGLSVNTLGYYFIFALLGVVTTIIDAIVKVFRPQKTIEVNLNDIKKKFDELGK